MECRDVPKGDIGRLFDHCVGARCFVRPIKWARPSPRIPQRSRTGVGLRTLRELAVELGEHRPARGHVQLGADGGKRGISGNRRAVDDKARAGKRLEDCMSTQSWAQASRARRISGMPLTALILAKRVPNSLRVSLSFIALKFSPRPPPLRPVSL